MKHTRRRHVAADESARVPAIVDLENWTAAPWQIAAAGPHADGHHDDFVATLSGTGPNDGLRTKVVVTSYDLDGRDDAQLVEWVEWIVRDAIATARRSAAA